MTTFTPSMTLEAFLQLPDTQPASEFIRGTIIQKPMPQGEHSRIQGQVCAAINQLAEPPKLAYAFPELRCVFGGDAIVPDVAVFRWSRISRTPSGRIANRFDTHPDWAIAMLSPEQSQTTVLEKLLHCSQQGSELGWLIDPNTETVLIVFPEQRVQILRGDTQLPVLNDLDLSLTPQKVFGWLSL